MKIKSNLIERLREDARTQAEQYGELKVDEMLAWDAADRIEELEAVVNRLADISYTWVKHAESNWSDLDILQADINAMQDYAAKHATEKSK